MRGERMAEVYGRGGAVGDRLTWIGYSAKKPDREWCDGHVSATMGKFEGVAWDKERMAWVLTFASIFEAGPDECDDGVALTKAIEATLAEDDANEEGPNPGTFPGTLAPAEPSSIWD